MKINGEIILPHIYLLTFDTQYELCMSFVRMQEFYESDSSKFRGKFFELEEYMDYWSLKFGNGAFTYPSVWNGFNLPSSVYYKWMETFPMKQWRQREHDIIYEVGNLIEEDYGVGKLRGQKFYVIAVHGDDNEETIDHESAHAFYHLYPSYKRTCQKMLKGVDRGTYKHDKKKLLDMGYCKAVIDDELQAYYSVENGGTIETVHKFRAWFSHSKKTLK